MNQQQLVSSLGLAGFVVVVVAQPVRADVIKVTAVELNPTENGIEIVLKTTDNKQLQVFASSFGKTFVANIVNTQLQLPDNKTFRRENPIEGIAFVSVNSVGANSIRVVVTGKTELPLGQVTQNQRGLVLSLTAPSQTTAQKPKPEPEPTTEVEPSDEQTENTTPQATAEPSATKPVQPTEPSDEAEPSQAEGEEPIEVTVTATRTEESVDKIPRSVTVITREQIEDQSRNTRNLTDILSQTVPGLGPPTNRRNTFGSTLRGRGISVLIDGIPQNANLGSIPAQLTTIDPEAIERIEVIRGPNAIYGGQATGGLINIVTRKPSEERLTSRTQVGLNNSLTNSADSFGYNLQHSISGTEDQFDYIASFSIATTGGFFDAQGDRIPSDQVNADTTQLNGLLKFGVNLGEGQRLQLTFNHFDQHQDTDFISDNSIFDIPGIQKARAIRIPEGTTVIGADDTSSLTTTNRANAP